jgi:hypothetical protein
MGRQVRGSIVMPARVNRSQTPISGPTPTMRRLSENLWSTLNRNIGSCPRCMKTAFLAAFISWPPFIALWLLWPSPAIAALFLVLPVSLTALWVLHFITYAVRLTARQRTTPDVDTARRRFFFITGKAISTAFFAASWLPFSAVAQQSSCGSDICPDDSFICCLPAAYTCCPATAPWMFITAERLCMGIMGGPPSQFCCFASEADARSYIEDPRRSGAPLPFVQYYQCTGGSRVPN